MKTIPELAEAEGSITALARRLGYTRSQLSIVVNGRERPSGALLASIAREYGDGFDFVREMARHDSYSQSAQ